ncbi:hemagglutinin [Plakobranchus ocellatus]|uniref:Hemagglutinin n=1 Tax=Plakobranchus ocellatus TaxID=259542 RepID=A0AAV4ADK9_9GAST|nr:hemagglutinin [Plakobranchus ocellatus]
MRPLPSTCPPRISAAFNCFLTANRLYWRSDTDFEAGACGVLRGAYDEGYDMDVVADAFKTVGITLKDCSDPSTLITAELHAGTEQKNLKVSYLIQPLFRIRVPSSTRRVTVTSSDGLSVALSDNYKRNGTALASGTGAVSIQVNGGGIIYARFFRGIMGRISGASATLSFD